MSDGFDVDAFLDGYEHRVESATIYRRNDLVAEIGRLEAELAEVAQTGATDDDGHVDRARDLSERIDAARSELEASKKVFWFQSIPRDDWALLVLQHPPSEEDRKAAQGRDAVARSFWPEAIAACSLDPPLSVEQAKRMMQWRVEDSDAVCAAVMTANQAVTAAPKSPMATAVAQALAGSSTSPKGKESRGGSSMAGKGARSRSTGTTKKAG